MLLDSIAELIGEVPAGFEPLRYIAAVLILIFLLYCILTLFFTVFNWVGGR